jgi:hypothetical protein
MMGMAKSRFGLFKRPITTLTAFTTAISTGKLIGLLLVAKRV